MIKLVKPSVEHRDKYIEMIKEWQNYGEPYAPCIIEYDCSNPVSILDYTAVLKVVDDYSNGKVFEYDIDYIESADFYFIFNDNDLIGMGEIIHPLYRNSVRQIILGIRPSKRNKGYGTKTINQMIKKLKNDRINEIIAWHYSKDNYSKSIMEKLNFQYQKKELLEISQKEIKCYTKKLK